MKTNLLPLLLACIASFSLFAQNVAPGQSPPENNPLGHLECVIRADTNCVTHEVTLEAWNYYLFTGVSIPVTVPWSTGVTAHKITITPPGTWSWDVTNNGCDHFLNEINFPDAFFSGPIDIEQEGGQLIVNTLGYDSFSSFQWNTAYNQLTPYPTNASGTYSLTVTDALGCSFTDEISLQIDGQPCPNPPPPGGESCASACVYCNFDGFQGINDGTPSGGNTICGQIAVHNDQWYGFVAGSDSIDLDVITSNCINGDGLQIAIFDDCSDADAIICNAGCTGCGDQTLTLSYADYVPGHTYWLMIDGYAGDVCNFEIDIAGGSATAPPPSPADQPIGPVVVCPGAAAVYHIPEAAGAGFYHWVGPVGSSINGLSNNVNINAPQGAEVTITFGASQGNVCVQTGNTCLGLTALNCLPVVMQALPVTVKPSLYVCQEDLPFTWNEEPYPVLTSAGTFVLTSTAYSSILGCDSTVEQTIVIANPITTTLAPLFLCAGECFDLGGESYCDQGQYTAVLTSYLGCDSVVNFTLFYVNPVAAITGPDVILCGQDLITLESADSPGTKVWQDASGQIVGQGNTLSVTEGGQYILTTTLTSGTLTCIQADTILITHDSTAIDVQISGASEGCNTDSLVLSTVVSVGNPQFEWSGPGGFTSTVQNPLVTLPGLYTVTVTTTGGCLGTATAEVGAVGGTPDVTAQGDIITCLDTGGQLNGGSNTAGATFSWTGPEGYFSTEEDPIVIAEGAYTLTVTGPGGCTNVAAAVLEYQTDVPFVALSNDTILCTNYPQLQVVTTANNPVYSWSGPGNFTSSLPNPEATESGVYTVTVTETATGCSASASATVFAINVVLLIQTDTIISPVIGQNNGSIQITVPNLGDPVIFFWYLNGQLISNSEDVYNLAPGTYTLVVSDTPGCSNSTTFVLDAVSGTNELTNSTPWLVRPNPSAGRFELSCQACTQKATQLRIHDSSGRLVSEQPVPATQTDMVIDLTGSPVGVYLLEIRDENRSTWMKLVVQR